MPYDIIIGRNDLDKIKFGSRGLVNIGKSFVKMGQTTSLANNILLDVARAHVILVSGKRGSGKCLHGDTLITLANGATKKIKELENNKENILALNENLKIIPTAKTEFFKKETNRLIKLRLRSGKEIKLTPEHPLLTIKGWEEARSNIDTGMPASIIAQMIHRGLIKTPGAYAPEAIVPVKEFFKELAKRQMIVYENGKRVN